MSTTITRKKPAVRSEVTEAEFDAVFKPKGAMAFFLLLVLLTILTWYGIYLLMLSRS